jgi:hypothetical protein
VKTALTVSLLTLTLASCSGDVERTLMTQFFAASRLRDLTALHSMATVVFEPSVDGIVSTFEVVSISGRRGSGAGPESEDVLIRAPVRMPDGRTLSKRFVVTMRRGLPDSEQRWGGWTITAIKDVLVSASTPPS